MQNLKKNWFAVSKWQEFGEFSSEHSKFSKVSTLIGPFCSKYITFDLKKYRGVIFDETDWKVMQNLKKNWLTVWKMTSGIWKVLIRAIESVKIGTLMGSFYPK